MSFFTKALSKVGIGAAKVDAVLDNESVQPGELITGVIKITGGKVEQKINKIDLDVYCNYFVEEEYERDDETHTRVVERTCRINSWDLNESFMIQPEEYREIPFEVELSQQAPLSIGKSETWLNTNLDIDFALDKDDKDYIHVVPNEMQAATLGAIEQLGFDMVEAESEGCNSHRGELPFIQEFEFKARRGDFRGKLDELELVMMLHGDELTLFLEIDRKARGIGGLFAEMFDMDESNVRVTVDSSHKGQLVDILHDVISQHS